MCPLSLPFTVHFLHMMSNHSHISVTNKSIKWFMVKVCPLLILTQVSLCINVDFFFHVRQYPLDCPSKWLITKLICSHVKSLTSFFFYYSCLIFMLSPVVKGMCPLAVWLPGKLDCCWFVSSVQVVHTMLSVCVQSEDGFRFCRSCDSNSSIIDKQYTSTTPTIQLIILHNTYFSM